MTARSELGHHPTPAGEIIRLARFRLREHLQAIPDQGGSGIVAAALDAEDDAHDGSVAAGAGGAIRPVAGLA
jgi:hypothetical protein